MDIVICEKSKGQTEASLEKWRGELESRGKTEYMCLINGNVDGKSIRIQGVVLTKSQRSIWELQCRKMGSVEER